MSSLLTSFRHDKIWGIKRLSAYSSKVDIVPGLRDWTITLCLGWRHQPLTAGTSDSKHFKVLTLCFMHLPLWSERWGKITVFISENLFIDFSTYLSGQHYLDYPSLLICHWCYFRLLTCWCFVKNSANLLRWRKDDHATFLVIIISEKNSHNFLPLSFSVIILSTISVGMIWDVSRDIRSIESSRNGISISEKALASD